MQKRLNSTLCREDFVKGIQSRGDLPCSNGCEGEDIKAHSIILQMRWLLSFFSGLTLTISRLHLALSGWEEGVDWGDRVQPPSLTSCMVPRYQITSTFTISGAFCARLTFTFTLEDLEEAASSVWVDREAHSTQKLKKRCNFLLLLHIKKIPPQQKRIPETKSLFATMPIWPFHWALFGICHCYQLLSRSFLG